MMRRTVFLALALASAASLATTFVPLTLEERIARADVVVVGEIAAAQSVWEDGRIVTFAQIDVAEVWKGMLLASEADGMLLGVPGGAVGDIAQRVGGAPALRVGERALFLLGPPIGPGHARRVIQLDRGLLPISDGAVLAGGPRRVDVLRATVMPSAAVMP